MVFGLGRRNLSCFYCGSRSARKWNGGTQQWQCKECEAVNYLDKTGQITDPPAQASPLPNEFIRFAHPTSSAQNDGSDADQVFCATCIKNQHIVKESLASYLPPESAAEYDQYVAKYESYRAQLEQRYPQVCARCAPGAEARLQRASYTAKTDHLRRMMDRTKSGGSMRRKPSLFKSSWLRLAGFGSRGSALFQVGWHTMMIVLLLPQEAREPGLEQDDIVLGQTPTSESSIHVGTAARDWLIRSGTIVNLTMSIWIALFVSVITLWWHPQMRARQTQTGGKLDGLGQFYLLQTTSLVLRLAAFYYLGPWTSLWHSLPLEMVCGIHAFLIVFICAVLLLSANIVRLNTKPIFTFPTHDEPVLRDIPPPQPERDYAQQFGRSPQSTVASPFPIDRLAPTPQPSHHPQNPPTPPPDEENDPDSMDWTSTTKQSNPTFNPQPRVNRRQESYAGPSPFHGTLPAAPVPPSHRMRNPGAYQPSKFQKATEVQQSAFANNIATPVRRSTRQKTRAANVDPYDSDTTSFTIDDDDATSVAGSEAFPRRRRKQDMNMADPSFFPQEDLRDTGLEDMFSTAFDLQDTPTGIAGDSEGTRQAGWFGWGARKKGKAN